MDKDANLDEKDIIFHLQHCESEIARLLSQLEQQQNLKASLEQKLLTVRSLKAPVARLPRELLSMIFFELIHDDLKAIGPILFVCRHWNDVVCQSSMLWSKITASFPTDIRGIKREGGYLKAAINYGCTAPLHIAIHLPSVDELWERLGRKMLDSLSDCPAEWVEDCIIEPEYELGNVVYQLEKAHGDAQTDGDRSFPQYDHTNSAIYAELFSTASAITNRVCRLRSLALHFHDQEFMAWLLYGGFNIFYKPTPMLEELIIVDNRVDEHYRRSIKKSENFFVHPIPSLFRLTWWIDWPVTTVLVPLSRLTQLRFWVNKDFSNFPPNEYIYNLTHLFLDLQVNLSADKDETFLLPYLEDLVLRGDYLPKSINAPRLKTLRLLDYDSPSMLAELPVYYSLERLHVWVNQYELVSLRGYIKHLPLLTELAFLEEREADIKDIMKKTKDSGVPVKGYQCPEEYFHQSDFSFYERYEIRLDS